MGSKNHEVVPTSLISQISKLRSGGINKILGSLAKRNLVSRVQNAKCNSVWSKFATLYLPPLLSIYLLSPIYRRWISTYLRRLWLSRHPNPFQKGHDVSRWQSDWSWQRIRHLHCQQSRWRGDGTKITSVSDNWLQIATTKLYLFDSLVALSQESKLIDEID